MINKQTYSTTNRYLTATTRKTLGERGGGGEEQGDCHGQDGEQHLARKVMVIIMVLVMVKMVSSIWEKMFICNINVISMVRVRMVGSICSWKKFEDDSHLDQLSLRTQED